MSPSMSVQFAYHVRATFALLHSQCVVVEPCLSIHSLSSHAQCSKSRAVRLVLSWLTLASSLSLTIIAVVPSLLALASSSSPCHHHHHHHHHHHRCPHRHHRCFPHLHHRFPASPSLSPSSPSLPPSFLSSSPSSSLLSSSSL